MRDEAAAELFPPSVGGWRGTAVEFPNTFLGTGPSVPPPTPGCQLGSGQALLQSRASNGPGGGGL